MPAAKPALCQTYVTEMFRLYLEYYERTVKSDILAARRAIERYVERNDVHRDDCLAAAHAAQGALGKPLSDRVPGLDRIGKKPDSDYPGKNAYLRARAEEQGRAYRPARRGR